MSAPPPVHTVHTEGRVSKVKPRGTSRFERGICKSLKRTLEQNGYDVVSVGFRKGKHHVVLRYSYSIPHLQEFLTELHAVDPQIVFLADSK